MLGRRLAFATLFGLIALFERPGGLMLACAQPLGLGNQMLPDYAPPPYSPTFRGYEPAPVIGGYTRVPDEPPPPEYQPAPSYPQYLAPNAGGMAGGTFNPGFRP